MSESKWWIGEHQCSECNALVKIEKDEEIERFHLRNKDGEYFAVFVCISCDKKLSQQHKHMNNKLTFGDAVAALKEGKRVSREGWNGKGMYLWLLPAAMVQANWCREPHLKEQAEANGGEIECLGSIRMMTADKKVLTGWLASQTDILAEDWTILEN